MTTRFKLRIEAPVRTCYGKCSMLSVVSGWRCLAVALLLAKHPRAALRNNVKLFPRCFSGGRRHLALRWRFGVRVNRCVFEKKKEWRAMLLYRNFYLTLKST